MINPLNQRHLDGLYRAVEHSRWRLQPFREKRVEVLRQFVGYHYSESGAEDRVPLNMIQLATHIYLRQLVSKAPRALVSSHNPQLKPLAADMEAWMDKATVGMRLAETLRLWVLNAIFSIGIIKVGEASAGQVEILGTTQHIGQPFAEVVDLDDWAHDITARIFPQIQFGGNRYRVVLEEAQENELYDKAARQNLSAMTRMAYNERGDPRSTTLSQGTVQFLDEFQEHCELWDLWLPREKLVVTVPYQEGITGGFSGKPLRVVNWQGPDLGPFHILSYGDVPNNVMPVAPAMAQMDLHELVNRMWRKLGRQIDRQKTITGYMGAASEDAERVQKGDDGDMVRMDFPDRVREFTTGGAKGENLVAAMQVKDLFVYMAGNLDALGGLSPQASTLGQDELLNKNSAAQVAEMQDRTVNGTQEVYRSLALWWYKNPILTYSATREIAGIEIPVVIPPQLRQVPFEHLDFDIDPYSMQHSTPQTRMALIMQLLQNIFIPLGPVLKQEGISLKWPELIKLIGKYGNLPELEDIIAMGPPPNMQGPMGMAQEALQGGEEPHAPAVTSRTNTRISRPGMTSSGQSQVMQQLAMGGGQPKQQAMAGRPVG